jgi:hypothetical protein
VDAGAHQEIYRRHHELMKDFYPASPPPMDWCTSPPIHLRRTFPWVVVGSAAFL